MGRIRKRVRKAISGFTIMEVMVASIVSVIVLGGATVALIQGLKVWQQEQIKSELNLDLEISMEHLRQDLRLSSVGIGLMAFYSTNSSSDFIAISMPLSEDKDSDGLLDRDSDGNVVWNKTVVYHVRPGTPDQMLRTVFDDRNTNATAADIYTQLSNVVASTAITDLAACCLSGETVSSDTIFQNLVDLHFTPPDIYFDGYWPEDGHAGEYNWGSLVLGPGTHDLEFKVEGKNDLSSGYRMEIDKVSVTPSGSEREGEIFLPNNSHPSSPYFQSSVSGGVAVAVERGSGWTWGGNSAMSIAATGVGSRLTLEVYNDLWCDSNFRDPGPKVQSNCSVTVDNAFRTSDPFVWDVVVAPDKGTAWTASQVGDLSDTFYANNLTTITNFIYGGTNVPSMTINRSGSWVRFEFQRGANSSFLITNVVASAPFIPASTNVTFNGGDNYVYMDVDGPLTTNSDWISNIEIDAAQNYEVTFQTLEINGDKDLDLFVGGGSGGNDIKFYENTGTESIPVINFPGGGDPNWQGINEANITIPAFGDLDNDGDYDMIVGVPGYAPRPFKFYRNEGTVKTANMVLIDPATIVGHSTLTSSGNPSPVLADIDGDGDLDLFSGWNGGPIWVHTNSGSPTEMEWEAPVQLRDSTNGLIAMSAQSAPELADIDGDGDYDLFSGSGVDGLISFWENTTTNNTPVWTFVTNAFGDLANGSTHCVARFADINADGDLDLFVGNNIGQLWIYQNTGDVNNALWGSPAISGGVVPSRAAPALCNIDADINGGAQWTNEDLIVIGSIDGVSTNKIVGLSSFEVGYATQSVFRSGIFDTTVTAPVYNELNWTEIEDSANGWDVDVRIRSSNDRKMRDLTDLDWTDASAGDGGYMDNNAGNTLATLPKKRYVQYEARFKCNEGGMNPEQHTNSVPGAKLRDVTIDWPGRQGLCDLLVSFGRGPDCGIVNVTVDGQEFIKGVQVDMTIFKEGRTGMNSANGVLEVRPLNTGK